MRNSYILLIVLFTLGISKANSENIDWQICYPVYQSEDEYCDFYSVPEDGLLWGLVGPNEIEDGLTGITKYGYELSDTISKLDIQDPILKALINAKKDDVIEAISAAGGGPALALLNIALNNMLTGGGSPDPITQLAELLLKRLAEIEDRVIGRIDEQFQQEAIDSFAGLSRLYEIYGTADTIEKRAQPLYSARLSEVDVSLDSLIENFQNNRFQGAHVKNYHAYLQLVALRLAVLAEVERLTYYGLYGEDLEQAHGQYSSALKVQYQLVLEDVFQYIDGLAASNEWRIESDKRFDFKDELIGSYSGYSDDVRNRLFETEKGYYDQQLSYTTSGRRRTTVYYKRGDEMMLKDLGYTFSGVPQSWHFTYHPVKGTAGYDNQTNKKYRYLISNGLFHDQIEISAECDINRYNPLCRSDMWSAGFNASRNSIGLMKERHKSRAYNQFIKIYYEPTQEILDKWYELYRPGEIRPKNDLDLLVDSMK